MNLVLRDFQIPKNVFEYIKFEIFLTGCDDNGGYSHDCGIASKENIWTTVCVWWKNMVIAVSAGVRIMTGDSCCLFGIVV